VQNRRAQASLRVAGNEMIVELSYDQPAALGNSSSCRSQLNQGGTFVIARSVSSDSIQSWSRLGVGGIGHRLITVADVAGGRLCFAGLRAVKLQGMGAWPSTSGTPCIVAINQDGSPFRPETQFGRLAKAASLPVI
jgi:hypothetical protein